MRIFVPLLLLLAACQPTVSIGRHGPATNATNATSDDGLTDEGSTTPLDDDGDSTGATPADESSSEGLIDWCADEPTDERCTACTKDLCCEQVTACAENWHCYCYWECVGTAGLGMSGQCVQWCDPVDPQDPQYSEFLLLYNELSTCALYPASDPTGDDCREECQ